MWRSEEFVRFFKEEVQESVRKSCMEEYLKVIDCIKLPPLPFERVLEYTGALLSDPKATRMWSLWLSAEAGSGNVREAQRMLTELDETPGIEADLFSELDVIASAVAFNIHVPIAIQRFDQLLVNKRYTQRLWKFKINLSALLVPLLCWLLSCPTGSTGEPEPPTS